MTIEQLRNIAKFNLLRGNAKGEFDGELETRMLDEEKIECMTALDSIYEDLGQGKEVCLEKLTKAVDGLCDYEFVLGGTIAKGSRAVMNTGQYRTYASILTVAQQELNWMLSQIADVAPCDIDFKQCLDFVIEANATKPKEKVNGKIIKPVDFVPPDGKIRAHLQEELNKTLKAKEALRLARIKAGADAEDIIGEPESAPEVTDKPSKKVK